MRFLSAQLVACLKNRRWLELAANSNARAANLAAGLSEIDGVSLWFPVETNMIFLTMPETMADTLAAADCIFYVWGRREGTVSARLVTSFDTTVEDVARFLDVARDVVE